MAPWSARHSLTTRSSRDGPARSNWIYTTNPRHVAAQLSEELSSTAGARACTAVQVSREERAAQTVGGQLTFIVDTLSLPHRRSFLEPEDAFWRA